MMLTFSSYVCFFVRESSIMVSADPRRYGVFWHNLDQAVASPPSTSHQSEYLMTMPWSGNGAFQTTVASGKTMRMWVEPWNAEAPFQTFTGTAGDSVKGANNAAGNPDFDLELVGTTQYAYQNIGFSNSGFNPANPLYAYFMGGYLELTVYVDQSSRGTVTAIGQHEVRGIGIGAVHASRSGVDVGPFSGHELRDTAATDFELASGLELLGSAQNFKKPQLLVSGIKNENQKMFVSIPIVPAKSGVTRMSAKDKTGSTFMLNTSRVATYTSAFQYADGTTPTIVTVTDGTGATAAGNTLSFSSALPDPLTIYVSDKRRIIRATEQPMQSLLAGYPLIEIVSTTGTVTVDAQFKMFYQVVVPISHPVYENAQLGNFTSLPDITDYRLFAAPAPGFSLESRGNAVFDMKSNARKRTVELGRHKNEKLLQIVNDMSVGPMYCMAQQGINQPVSVEDENWLDIALKVSPYSLAKRRRGEYE